MPKYKVVTSKEKKEFENFKEVVNYLTTYFDNTVPRDLTKERAMLYNMLSGIPITAGMKFEKDVLVKVYFGRRLLDTMTEREVHIDRVIRSILSEEHEAFLPDGISAMVSMMMEIVSKGIDSADVQTMTDMRTSMVIVISGVLRSVANGTVNAKVVKVDGDMPITDGDEEVYIPSKTISKEDVDRLYR